MYCSLPDSSVHGFSRQYWSELPCPPPGDLPDPGIKPVSGMSPALAGEFFTTSAIWDSSPICLLWNTVLLHCVQHYYRYLMWCCPFVCWLYVSPGVCGLYKGRDPHLHCGYLQSPGARMLSKHLLSNWMASCHMHPLLYGPIDLSDCSRLRPFTFPQGTNHMDLPVGPQAWQAHSWQRPWGFLPSATYPAIHKAVLPCLFGLPWPLYLAK